MVWTGVTMGHEEGVCHTPKGHTLLLGGTEPRSFFLKTVQPLPHPFFRHHPFEEPIPLLSSL